MIHLEITLTADGGITAERAREIIARIDPTDLAAMPTRRADISGAVCFVATIADGGPEPAPMAAATAPRLSPASGDVCSACGNANLVRSGTCMTCQNCGTTTGCS